MLAGQTRTGGGGGGWRVGRGTFIKSSYLVAPPEGQSSSPFIDQPSIENDTLSHTYKSVGWLEIFQEGRLYN